MFGHKREFEKIRRDSTNLWNNYNELYDKTNNLFKEYRHGTVRPKVDMLNDLYTELGIQVWNALNGLQKRIEKLEKVNEGNKTPTNKES